MTFARVAIYGLGLIGGSLGLCLRRRAPQARVTGIDQPNVLESRAAAEAAHELVSCADREQVAAALESADLAVMALPVRVIKRELWSVLDHARVVVDCGSTKRAICQQVAAHPRRGRFVPAHPMAGAPEGGIDQARADLFDGKQWLVCPEGSDPDAVAAFDELVSLAGATSVSLSAGDHDRAVARTSHLPQLLASALLIVGRTSGARSAEGPSFASATRVAGGPEAMWQDIFATNADEIAAALGELISALGPVRNELAAQPAALEAARDLLARAREERQR